MFFTLTNHPGQDGTLEPQFMVGYAFKDNSKVTLDIDGKQFSMFTKGSNAWMENPAEEPTVVDAMQKGHSMQLSANRGAAPRPATSIRSPASRPR